MLFQLYSRDQSYGSDDAGPSGLYSRDQSYGSDDAGPSGLNCKRPSSASSVNLASDSVPKKKRTAFEKRERARVSMNELTVLRTQLKSGYYEFSCRL